MNASASERMFALQWWKELSDFAQEELRLKHFPHLPIEAVIRSTSLIVQAYRKENK